MLPCQQGKTGFLDMVPTRHVSGNLQGSGGQGKTEGADYGRRPLRLKMTKLLDSVW
jgi:hypothetical protein